MSLVTVHQDGPSLSVQRTVAAFGAVLIRLPPSRDLHTPASSPSSSSSHQHPSSPSSFDPLPQQNADGILFNRLTHNSINMLTHAFDSRNASDVVVLEEDLEVSPDFSQFFAGAITMLHRHPRHFFCASSYNDNGFMRIARNNSALRLGQHFMALGWAITRTQFDEHIRGRWMIGDIWDAPFVKAVMGSAGACIFPEVARSKHHGDPDMAQPALTTSAVFQRAVLDEIQLAPAPLTHGGDAASFCWDCILPEAYIDGLLRRIAASTMVCAAAFHPNARR